MEKLKIAGGGQRKNLSEKQEKKYTNEDLKIMQAWGLQKKIQVSQTRILEWYKTWDGMVYVSFSGGKDSTVLADLAARVCKVNGYKLILWFSDTGLEFPEVKYHVKHFGEWLKRKYDIEVETVINYPKDRKTGKRITFKDVILTKGYPIVSKRISGYVSSAKNNPNCVRAKYLSGEIKNTMFGGNGKWYFLVDAPFKISNYCCDKLKKQPNRKFAKDNKLFPIFGNMACESQNRKQNWKLHGCNVFSGKEPKSQPLSFWTEQNILEYLVKFNIPYASVYGDILQDEKGKYYTTGYNRTGCVFCGYGCHLEKEPNRFQRLKQTHPKLWKYCMKPVSEGGLGMKEVLEYINVKTE